MNIQQFQYVLAVAENRHFERAAEACFIGQSTLSTMISRFEEEIGITIFDRKKKPVEVTAEGRLVIEQLQLIDREIGQLRELTKEIKGEVKGNISISVIPTIAPFLLPRFLQGFANKFPDLNIQVKEQTTNEIVRQLKSRVLDIGILSTPLHERDIVELDLYDEPFLFYDAGAEATETPISNPLDVSNLCLLEEGHCMRTQVVNLCDLHKSNLKNTLNFDYKAGSIDSLLRFVRANRASTLLPYLSTIDLPTNDAGKLSPFADPIPFRTIGLVVHRHFVKKRILEALKKEIQEEVVRLLPKKTSVGQQLSPV